MADPVAGWQVLTDCLKKNGLMKIGLYSELARKHIAEVKEITSQENTDLTNKDLIRCRRRLVDIDHPIIQKLKWSLNFYSTSETRDLLFHVQEHQFTIMTIRVHKNI